MSPRHAPSTSDEYIANARTVVQSGTAPYGCTLSSRLAIARPHRAQPRRRHLHGGRPLRLHDPGVVEALEVMERMLELSFRTFSGGSSPCVINPDEAAFTAQTVAYSVKYPNARVRFASSWSTRQGSEWGFYQPTAAKEGPCSGRPGSHSYGTEGASGRPQRMRNVTRDALVSLRSLGTSRDAAGQLGAFKSLPSSSTPSEP